MKNITVFFFFMFCSLTASAQYAKNFFGEDRKVKQEKWGFQLKAGISKFDGDIEKKNNSPFPQSELKFAAGMAFDYYFIPQLGFIAEYMYLPIEADLPHLKFSGTVNSFSAYLSVNVLNIFKKKRNQRWNIYLNSGIGVSLYDSESTISPNSPVGKANGKSLTCPVEFELEYCLSNNVALMWGLQYRFHEKDNFEAMREKQGNSGDGMYISTISLKFRFPKKSGNSLCRRGFCR